MMLMGFGFSQLMGVQKAFNQFYSSLFGVKMDNITSVKSIVIYQGPRLSVAHNEYQVCSIQDKDIKLVLDSIPVIKAPGLDGFNSQFFKSAWPIIETEFYQAIKDFFATGKLLKEINVTSISLVHKLPVPTSVSNLEP